LLAGPNNKKQWSTDSPAAGADCDGQDHRLIGSTAARPCEVALVMVAGGLSALAGLLSEMLRERRETEQNSSLVLQLRPHFA
jgi:hypothetical protein